jgi:hypothetical protein
MKTIKLFFVLMLFINFNIIQAQSKRINHLFENNQIIKHLDINLKNEIIILKEWFKNNYLIEYNQFTIKKSIKSTEKYTIYDVLLSNNLATSLNKVYTFLYINNENKLFLLPVEFNSFILTDSKNDMLGGFVISREYEYYTVFEIDKYLKQVLDINQYCKNGIKVGYFRDDECFEYNPNRLKFLNKKNEVIFYGTIKIYCKSFESRDEKSKVISEKEVKIIFKYNIKIKKWKYDKKSIYNCW